MGLDGRVRHITVVKCRVEDARGSFASAAYVAASCRDASPRRGFQQVVVDAFVGDGDLRPDELCVYATERLLRNVGKLMEDRNQVPVFDHRHAWNAACARGVHAFQRCPMDRRTQDLRIEHSGQSDIGGVFGLTGDFLE